MYIVFEGIVGTGKTTHSKKLAEYLKKKYPEKKIVWTREPGGTDISQKIREIAQGTKYASEMDPICEIYLYAASRAQSLRKVVKPELIKNNIVVADRSYITALVNQGIGKNLGIDRVMSINKEAVGNITPDLIIFLDYGVRRSLKRTFDKEKDKWENFGEDFYRLTREGYLKVSKMKDFKDKWITVRMKDCLIEENFSNIVGKAEKRIDRIIRNQQR